MAFVAQHQIKRRHTVNLKRDLPGIVSELIEPLTIEREAQARKFIAYKQTMLTDQMADHLVMRLYREDVLNIQRVPDVLAQWDKPSFPDLEEPSVWRLFNGVTHALKGRVMDNPTATPKLHEILDGVCEEIH